MKLYKILIIFLWINSCSYPEMIRNELVYQNDFESEDFNNIDGGGILEFQGTKVLEILITMVLHYF